MKRWILLWVLLLMQTVAMAQPFRQVVFFGDSITDNGNLYHLLLKIIPKSPPYYEGRFSNGPTWAEYVGQHYQKTDGASYKIYAVAGATAIFHAPSSEFIDPSTLELQIYHYYIDTVFQKRDNTLFVIWIGGNDYVFDSKADPYEETNKVTDKIGWAIENLISHGAKNIVVMNLPNLAFLPKADENKNKESWELRSNLHNLKLANVIKAAQEANPSINIKSVDVHGIFDLFNGNIDEFNQKYGTHLSNTKESCWKGGFTVKQAAIADDLRAAFPKNYDVNAISQQIANNPDLAEAYRIAKAAEEGVQPCDAPDTYLFWDHLHPTMATHEVFSRIMIEKLNGLFS